jgi:arabinose-5-phosphate isomerase
LTDSHQLSDTLAEGREVLELEARAVATVAARLDEDFRRAVEQVLACEGRVVITGMGKSGAIGRKLAATLASTGTPALFLHPAEGVHGDLGMIAAGDLLIALSYSGGTEEIMRIVPAIKRIGVPIIAFTGMGDSALATAADVVLNINVEREACPLGLAPTTSTTVMLALGDALAVATMKARKFTRQDFALLHPAGALGRQALSKCEDVMRVGEQNASVTPEAPLREALAAISRAKAGAANVVDADGRLIGVVTDGDIRRSLLRDETSLSQPVSAAMSAHPKTIAPDRLAAEALRLMELNQIADMPVVDADGRPLGMLNIKDLLRAGIA